MAAVTNRNVLTWNERLHIAVDAAHGLQTNQLHDYSSSIFLDLIVIILTSISLQWFSGGVAGLEYLHNGCKPPIIHRDLKPSNILLNEQMQAKIADFGLYRAFATESDSHVSTRPAGTLGYLDPE